ncbi:MAG: 50S ribosomal protein L4 [Chloroflexota bacterium]|nr:50S ribosomal protein L4 [Chloroflexota bacterium]
MEIPVINQRGQAAGTVEVDEAVFDVPMNHSLVHQVVVAYQANKRQGTHDTKTRGEVSGGGRKPWIQKHTGRARQGSIRSPQWRHGGTVFGPHPRDYRQQIPRRMRQLALKCAISEKIRQGGLVCIDSLDSLDGKTKSMVTLLSSLGLSKTTLVVTEEATANVAQSGRNLKQVWSLPVNQLNAHELLRRTTVLITRDALKKGEAQWAASPDRRPASVRAGNAGEDAQEA